MKLSSECLSFIFTKTNLSKENKYCCEQELLKGNHHSSKSVMYTESFNDFIGTVWGDFLSHFFHDLLTVQYSLAEVFSHIWFRNCWAIYIFKNIRGVIAPRVAMFSVIFQRLFLKCKEAVSQQFCHCVFFSLFKFLWTHLASFAKTFPCKRVKRHFLERYF